MTTRYFGERIKRNEDPRLLTGQGLYVDDVDLPNMLHVAFVRSPYAHAKINSIDVSQALERAGVVAVYWQQSGIVFLDTSFCSVRYESNKPI